MLDQLQYRLGQGSCLTTLCTGEVALDIGSDDGNRWRCIGSVTAGSDVGRFQADFPRPPSTRARYAVHT
jgi:hypothetical protein